MGYTRWELPENEQRLREAVAASTSIAGVARMLGIVPVGGNYKTIKHHITRLELDTSHHAGQAWNRGNYRARNAESTKNHIKLCLIREHGHQCMRCKLTEWLGQPITLELEHKDGVNSNNDPGNLELLCPNCHSQTPTWRRKKAALLSVTPW